MLSCVLSYLIQDVHDSPLPGQKNAEDKKSQRAQRKSGVMKAEDKLSNESLTSK